jgi:hypothetical protein
MNSAETPCLAVVAALVRSAAVRCFLPSDSGFRGRPIVRRGLPVIGLVLMPGTTATMPLIMVGFVIITAAIIFALIVLS